MRRGARIFGWLLTVAGALTLAWAATVYFWQDPFTWYQNNQIQHRLAHELTKLETGDAQAARPAFAGKKTAKAAASFRRSRQDGDPIGTLTVPRIGLHKVVVYGTDYSALLKGPGLDPRSFFPGQGKLVYIAGHRTTHGAPFSHIDLLRKGDLIELNMPYGEFRYRVSGTRVVAYNDMSVLRSPGHEVLRLQACHPRFFATHRIIVYALPEAPSGR